MKIEFIEFYPSLNPDTQKLKNMLGSVHIYIHDLQMDVRGIIVNKFNKGIRFAFPSGFVRKDGKIVRFPFLNFTDKRKNKEIMDFLVKEVRPLVLIRLRTPEVPKNQTTESPVYRPLTPEEKRRKMIKESVFKLSDKLQKTPMKR